MVTATVESRTVEVMSVPRLTELFIPCPVCGGTTDIDLRGHVFCHSCQQQWTLAGKPILENAGTV